MLSIVLVNLFPKGYIFLGGDVLQAINLRENFSFYYYEWFGRAAPFYAFFYLLDIWQISDWAQLSWYLGIFLGGAYFSFLSFLALLFPRSSAVTRVLSALFYAANVYTLYVFTAAWGYSHYQILYIFIPLLTGIYIRFLETGTRRFLGWFLFFSFLASMSFTNPAFALSTAVYFFFLTLFLVLFRYVRIDKRFFGRLAFLVLGSFLMNAYWLLPHALQIQSGIQEVYSSEFVDLNERLQKTSNIIYDTVRLLPTSEQDRYYPYNFPYPALSDFKKYVGLLAFLPFFLILFLSCREQEKNREQRLFRLFFGLLVVFIALVARVRYPFDTLNNILFQWPGFNVLRSYDKLATFTPFLLSVLLYFFLRSLEGTAHFKKWVGGFLGLVIILALPFFAGGLQTKMSYILDNQKAKDFQTAKQSALVKVPNDYYAVQSIFEADPGDYKIAMLPYSPGSSVGRVNLPVWKVNGPDVVTRLYNRRYVELYDYYIPQWMFAKDFENDQFDPQWITDLYGLLGIKYVFYHKDAKPASIEKMQAARLYLEKIGALKRVSENDSFLLYTIDDGRLFPYVYTSSETDVTIKASPVGLSEDIQGLKKNATALPYDKINPKKVKTPLNTSAASIFLNEKYDPLWRAVYTTANGERLSLKRDNTVKYANAWKIPAPSEGGTVEISFAPLMFFVLGQWLTGIALFFLGLSTVIFLRKNH